jgi:quercetin dioxygenase-like cupin family protein
VEIISGRPYTEEGMLRTFTTEVPDEEYVWHRDKKDRNVEILEGEGWQLQFEGSLPYLLNDINTVFIPKNVYHRLIKGYNTLRVRINETI